MSTPRSVTELQRFLKDDLHDTLRWVFVGAVTWQASRTKPDKTKADWPNQDAIAMYANVTPARALYEFFYGPDEPKKRADDDARVCDFTSATGWKPDQKQNKLYKDYMARHKPANKRIFHLVYERPSHAGGHGPESEHIKNKVLSFAKDLRKLTQEFASNADDDFRGAIKEVLGQADAEAQTVAAYYKFDRNPLL